MRPNWHGRWRMLAFAIDLFSVGGVLVLWTIARFGPSGLGAAFVPAPGQAFGRAPLAFAIPAWLLVFAGVRLYSPQRCQNALDEGRRLVMAGPGAAVATILLGFAVKDNPARTWLAGALVLGTLGAAVGRQTLRAIVVSKRERGAWMTPAVVVGHREAKRMIEAFASDPAIGVDPVATCGFEWGALPSWSIADAGNAAAAGGASEVLIVAEDLERSEVRSAVEGIDGLPLSVTVLPGLDHMLLGSLRLVTIGNEPGLALDSPSLHRYQVLLKRTTDVVIGSLLFALTSPLMAACAALVKIGSRGPVFFRQAREGYLGKPFDCFKFRTMRHDADERAIEEIAFFAKSSDDPRITRVGRFLRRTSLDELPQLWNVIRGDMSLVGPRPLSLWEAEQLGLGRRMIVRPGLSGLWQVSGRSIVSPEERIRLDLVYVQNWSLLLDLSILLRTVPAVVGRRGAY